jgi:hypothetical protein
MTNVYPANVVLLTDATNAAACQRLRDMVRTPSTQTRYPRAFSYYYADGFYFVSYTWVVPQGRVYTGFAPLVVLRSDFTYVDTFGM